MCLDILQAPVHRLHDWAYVGRLGGSLEAFEGGDVDAPSQQLFQKVRHRNEVPPQRALQLHH